jgi:hypothetical protein
MAWAHEFDEVKIARFMADFKLNQTAYLFVYEKCFCIPFYLCFRIFLSLSLSTSWKPKKDFQKKTETAILAVFSGIR